MQRWVDLWATPLLLIAVRISWIWPLLEMGRRWLTPSSRLPWLPFWSVTGLLVGALLTARIGFVLGRQISVARGIAAGFGLLAVAGAIWGRFAADGVGVLDPTWVLALGEQLAGWQGELPPPLLATLLAVLLWLRGLSDGSQTLSHERVWSVFLWGFLMLCVVLVAGHVDPLGIPPGTENWLLLLFGAGMCVLALSGMELATYGRKPQEGAVVRLDRAWLGSVTAIVGLLLVAGLLISALVSLELAARMLGWIGLLLQYIGLALGFVLFLLAYGVFRLLTPLIEWLQQRFAAAEWMQMAQDMQETAEQFEANDTITSFAVAPQYVVLLRWLSGIGVVLLIAILFAAALRRRKPATQEWMVETRDSVFSQALLADQLGRLRQLLWPRGAKAPEEWPYLSLEHESAGRQAIRAMYQRLLTAARRAGLPRQPMQTPDEYSPSLEGELAASTPQPTRNAAMAQLTALYDTVRYGSGTPGPRQVAEMEKVLAAIEARLREHEQRDDRPP